MGKPYVPVDPRPACQAVWKRLFIVYITNSSVMDKFRSKKPSDAITRLFMSC